jgi:hypothetical protein
MKAFIQKEISSINSNDNHYGSDESIDNQNRVFDYFIDNNIVDQDWFDDRLRFSDSERLTALINLI